MKKNWFDVRLYREGLRQLRVIGILGLVVMTLGGILAPVGEAIDYSSRMVFQMEAAGEALTAANPIMLTLMRVHPLLILGFPVLAPMMSLYLFHFLDRRNASDFYHVIPHTRNCLFMSLTAALLTWLLVILWGSTALCILTCKCLGKYLVLTQASVLSLLFTMTAASLLVAASVLLAISLTGTLFTNIVVSLLIIFLPRTILMVVGTCLRSAMPYVSTAHLFPLVDISWNVITGTIFGWLDGTMTQVAYSYPAGIYTLALAGIYFLLARFLFVRRKSEAAGQAAPSRKLQAVFRLAVSMTICLIPITIIFGAILESSISNSTLFGVAVCYLIAILAYFIYELIATKKLRNLSAAIPGLGILAALNIVFIFGMFGIYRFTEAQQPSAEEISYVRVLPEDESIFFVSSYYSEESRTDYFSAYLEDIRLDSPEIKGLVSERLGQTIRHYKDRSGNGSIGSLFGSNRVSLRLVGICSGSRTIYRNIYLTEADQQVLMEEYKKKEEVRTLFSNLPENDKKEVIVRSQNGLSDAAAGRIYEVMRGEVAEMDFEEWYTLVRGLESGGDTTVSSLGLEAYKGTEPLYGTLPISTKMPRTFAQYIKEYQEVNPDAQEIAEALKSQDFIVTDAYARGFQDGADRFSASVAFSINPYDPYVEGMDDEMAESGEVQDWEDSRIFGRQLGELIDQAAGKEIEADGDFILFQVTYYSGEEDYRYAEFYLAAEEEDLPDLMQEHIRWNEDEKLQ
ncbi:hypothetical protein [Hominifimenecus sp. rT4P-3]|uniref:hypothetical protein n=1 Tax=Hominifimenecus sp. rT4P-3 TaxID=3242979 RepID=UPI003DA23696